MSDRTSRPRNVTELISLVEEAQKRAPDYPEWWGRKEIEADLTSIMCGDGTPQNPGLLSAQVQAELALLYSGNELFLRQLDALADLSIASDDPSIQDYGRRHKSWCAPRLQTYDQRRVTQSAEVAAW